MTENDKDKNTNTDTDVTAPAPTTIRVAMTGTVNEDVEYVDGMTIKEVLRLAGINPDSLEQGTIAVDGEIVVNKKDLNEKITKEQQVIAVAPNAPNGS